MQTMSPLDSLFLHFENDVSHMHLGAVALFEDPAPAAGELAEVLAGKLALLGRYRQRVRWVPWGLGRPMWVEDPHFELSYHLRHTALPRPGGAAELRRLVGRVMAQPLDRRRPLWEMWLVEGASAGPLGPDLQASPLHGRRDLRGRPARGALRSPTGNARVGARPLAARTRALERRACSRTR